MPTVCQGLLSCRRHIGKREDPGDEVGSSTNLLVGNKIRDSRNRLTIESKGVFYKLLSTKHTRQGLLCI